VREFGMSAVLNGIALHRGISAVRRHVPHVLRLLAQRVAHGRTDEGRTRSSCSRTTRLASAKTARRISRWSMQPAFGMIPGLDVWRPCDTVETAQAWVCAVERDRPSCLLLSRQNCRSFRATKSRSMRSRNGGYVLRDWPEVAERPCIEARRADRDRLRDRAGARRPSRRCAAGHRRARRVDAVHHRVRSSIAARGATAVLPPGVPRVAIEAGRNCVLAAICRAGRRRGRDRLFWRIGAGRCVVRAFRADGAGGGGGKHAASLAERSIEQFLGQL
jgi:transketolase